MTFDVVIVDGRARISCVKSAMKKPTASELLVLDNSDRSEYRPAVDVLTDGGPGADTCDGGSPDDPGDSQVNCEVTLNIP